MIIHQLVKKSLFLLIFFSLFSCSYLQGRFWVAMGNYNYKRGNYIDSISFYSKAIRKPEFQPWVYYNLGLTYAALSENESALEMWGRAKELVDHPFLFYIYYNEGLIFFYQALYSRAFESFKQALRINPYDKDTKVNLEISLEKMRNSGRRNSNADSSVNNFSSISEPSQEEKDLIEFIMKSEGSPWIANQKYSFSLGVDPDY